MPLIRNSRIFNVNAKSGDEDYSDALDYRSKMKELAERFPDGYLMLQRTGWPKPLGFAGSPDIQIDPEVPPPIYIKLTRVDNNGVLWGYCERPTIRANGLVEVPRWTKADGGPDETTMEMTGEVYNVEFKKKPDLAFYLLYKSGILGSQFHIYDPEGDRKKAAKEKNDMIRLQATIRDMSDEKLKMMCQAYELSGVLDKDPLILQEELEQKILGNENKKKKDPTLLALKGVSEFLADVKNDDATRPRAIIQLAIDKKLLSYNVANSKWYFSGVELCYVPLNKVDRKIDVALNFLEDGANVDKWRDVLRSVIDVGYIAGMDKYGVRWIASQMGIALNQSEEALREALNEEFPATITG